MRTQAFALLTLGALLLGAALAACGADTSASPSSGFPQAGASNAAGDNGMSPIGADFPETPIIEAGVPTDAPELFDAAPDTSTDPLCVLEPQLSAGATPGAMFPSNWLRPRFRVAAADFDLFQIRLHSAAESHDLVIYTTAKTWYLPKEIWSGQGANSGLGAAASGGAIAVTIRALDSSAPFTAARASGTFNVAPASASGSILFPTVVSWALSPS